MLEFVRESSAPRVVPQEPEGDLDEAHAAIWRAVRHLFPRNAEVTQSDYGYLMVSWRMPARRGGSHHAAPIVIHIEPGLMLALWASEGEDRQEIAALQVDTVREALAGYDPDSRIPTCDMIVLGDG
jgi:hypothetical protein